MISTSVLLGTRTRLDPLRADNFDFALVGPAWLAVLAITALAAIEVSDLRSLPSDAIGRLAVDAWRLRVPAGSTIHREGGTAGGPPRGRGVGSDAGIYVTAPGGRTMTVRYCRPGALIGAVSLFSSPFLLPATIQVVTDPELLAFRPPVVRRAAERDVRVARVLIDELSERVVSFIAEIPGSAFASVRQRVARHLLDLASEGHSGPELVAAIGQQELADAVGPVCEVVVRARCGSCARRACSRRDGTRSCSSTPSGCSARPMPVRVEAMFPGGGTQVADGRACR